MRYMDRLQVVVDDMVGLLRLKTQTYGDSWKRRGGPGAWFTTVRPWDRLETIVGRHGGDVFAAIEADPSGKDGSALACVRDVMAYMILIEAHARVVLGVGPCGPAREEDRIDIQPVDGIVSICSNCRRMHDSSPSVVVLGRGFCTQGCADAYMATMIGEVTKRPCDRCGNGCDPMKTVTSALAPDRFFCSMECATDHLGPGTPEDGGHHARHPVCEGLEDAGEVTEDTQGAGGSTVTTGFVDIRVDLQESRLGRLDEFVTKTGHLADWLGLAPALQVTRSTDRPNSVAISIDLARLD